MSSVDEQSERSQQPITPAPNSQSSAPPPPPTAQATGSRESVRARLTRGEMYLSPFPHPSHVEKYEQLCPGFTKRVLASKDAEQKHRFELQKRELEAEIEDRRANRKERGRGQLFALIVALAGLFSATILGAYGHGLAGGFIGTGGLVALVSLFITGRRMDSADARNAPVQEPDEEPGSEIEHINTNAEQLDYERSQSKDSYNI